MRRLVIAALTNTIFFKAKLLPGNSNCTADHMARFSSMDRWATNNPDSSDDLILNTIILKLFVYAALSPSTKKAYMRSWNFLLDLCNSLN